MECKNCGAQIPDDSLVCEECGASVLDEMSDFNDETQIINQDELREAAAKSAVAEEGGEIFDENEQKRREQMQKMMDDKKKQLSEIEKRRNEKRKKQRRQKALIVGLICAGVVGGAGIGAYYIAQGLNGNTTAPSPSPAVTVNTVTAAPVTEPTPDVTPAVTPEAPVTQQTSDTSSASSSSSGSGSAASSGSGNQSWTATSGGASSSGGSESSQRTASNTGSQKTSSASTSSGSSGGSSSGGGSSSLNVTDSGLVSEPITARQVIGGEVILNEGTDRYLMTFIMDGKRYYANVSAGSTTEQIKNKTFSIDADATLESYGGNTVYEISRMKNTSEDYLFENSNTKLLTESDIQGMSKYDLALARNEIYARHGRKFKTPEYSAYFSSKSWYKINPNYNYDDDNSNLNEIEKKNVLFILNAENK